MESKPQRKWGAKGLNGSSREAKLIGNGTGLVTQPPGCLSRDITPETSLSVGPALLEKSVNWGEGPRGREQVMLIWFNTWWALKKIRNGLWALAWHIHPSTYMSPKWIYTTILYVRPRGTISQTLWNKKAFLLPSLCLLWCHCSMLRSHTMTKNNASMMGGGTWFGTSSGVFHGNDGEGCG